MATSVSVRSAVPMMEEKEAESSHVQHSDDEVDIPGRARALTADSINVPRTPSAKEKERKIGHRRVDETGNVTYKKKPTSELMAAIQLGIGASVGGLSSKPERDVLMQDFQVVESVFFPAEGSNLTPAHHYSDFRFKTYAPVAFRYFRELFSIQPDDFLLSLCDEDLKCLSNAGASGSIFYLTSDDEFIIKTVQHKEAEFLQKLLPGYYMNLNQNPRTLLPKFYGLYCYQCGGKNIRFVVMNNLLPSSVKLHEKYDLKGSTHKRKASKSERAKDSPTLKDLDFMENHPEGILLEKDKYEALMKTILRDVRVLESFKIMDYSLLVGFYNLDQAAKEKNGTQDPVIGSTPSSMPATTSGTTPVAMDNLGDSYPDHLPPEHVGAPEDCLARTKSMKTRLANYSTAIEAIQAHGEEEEDEDIPPGGIPCKNDKGERLVMYLGIIDILQSYRLKKKLEHTMKAIVMDGDTISVHRPGFYAQRFMSFFEKRVFRKLQTLEPPSIKGSNRFRKIVKLALKHSPSKRKPVVGRKPTLVSESDDLAGRRAIGGRPDLLPDRSTPPPSFDEAISEALPTSPVSTQQQTAHINTVGTPRGAGPTVVTTLSPSGAHVSEGRRPEAQASGTFQVSSQDPAYMSSSSTHMRYSPPNSISESTPTHTDYTEEQAFQAELDSDLSLGNRIASPARSKVTLSSGETSSSYTSALETQPSDNNGPKTDQPKYANCDVTDSSRSDPAAKQVIAMARNGGGDQETLANQSQVSEHVQASPSVIEMSPGNRHRRVRFQTNDCEQDASEGNEEVIEN